MASLPDYWRDELRGAPAELGWVPDEPRPPRLSGRSVVASTRLETALAQRVAQTAQALGVDAATVVLASYATLLHRYARTNDLLIAVADKPLRLYPEGLTPFAAFTADVAKRLAELHAAPPVTLENIQASFGRADAAMDVSLLYETGQMTVSLSADLFHEATAQRFLTHLERLLEAAAKAPATQLARLKILPEGERRRVLEGFNDTVKGFPTHETLHALLESQARRTPQRIALIFGDTSYTYRELNAESNRLARHLRGLGVKDGTLVALCLEKSAELVVAIFAILKAGGAYVPLDPLYPKDRLALMVEDAEAPVLVTTEALARELPVSRAAVVDLQRAKARIADESDADLAPQAGVSATPESLAYMIYTSGSTGKPKGVLVPHRSVVNFLYSMERICRFGQDEVTLCANTVSFDIVIPDLFLNFKTGATLVMAPRDASLDGELCAALMAKHRVTNMLATPSTWRILLDAGWRGSPELRIIAAGEALPRPLAEVLQGLGKSLWNGYGPTEVTVIATYYEVEDLSRPMFIGKAVDNTFIYILDEHGEPVPIGVPGEVYIAGAGVTRGYLKRPEQTAERFLRNPFDARFGGVMYKTGDLARFAPDGQIEYLGRNDDQVKIRGFRIELGEIEAALFTQPSIDKAVVVVRGGEDGSDGGEKHLIAYFTTKPGVAIAIPELRAALGVVLPKHMVPAQLVAIDQMPLNPNGKIDRKALPAPTSVATTTSTPFAAPRGEIEAALVALWKDLLKTASVGIDDNFFDLGGNSLLATRMVARLKAEKGLVVPVLKLFQTPTVAGLAAHVVSTNPQPTQPQVSSPAPTYTREPIAIIGMACRVPGADTPAELWQNLANAVDSVTHFGPHELDPGIADDDLENPQYVRARGIIRGGDTFDAAFFGIQAREAEILDPAQRQFLETTWSALEDAGYTTGSYGGKIGVYAGTGTNTYRALMVERAKGLVERSGSFAVMIANEKDYIATRTAHRLNLKGPAISVQTACSTSLVATHLAVQALRTHECDLAVAGAGSSTAPLQSGYVYQEGSMLSPDGRTRTFDADARGTVFSDGVGAIVLKRLSDALRDGDDVRAVILGSAVNNDGSEKASFTAPSSEGQAEVVTAAQRDAGVSPADVSYVEAHGTATPLGDPIEVEALTRAFRAVTQDRGYCAIGSLKSNLGHMVATAGVGGVIKTALALGKRQLPPSLHYDLPNPKLELDSSPFRVQTTLTAWEPRNGRRIAGVSSFGVGGTNAHVVLAEAPPPAPSSEGSDVQLVLLSAKSEAALSAQREELAAHLAKARADAPSIALADAAYTLMIGRKPLPYRLAVVVDGSVPASRLLQDPSAPFAFKRGQVGRAPGVAFLFPGQGAQHPGMARGLYDAEPVFRAAFDDAVQKLTPHLGLDLGGLVYPAHAASDAGVRLAETRFAQPALFAVSYALAKLWQSLGVKPTALAGHSIGELVAATLAGVMSLDDALFVVAARGRLMQEQPRGSMLSVRLPARDLAARLTPDLALAAVNAPSLSVAAGSTAAIEALRSALDADGIGCRILNTSHAFHSPMMDRAVPAFLEVVRQVRLSAPQIPIVSTRTGTWLDKTTATDPRYWAEQIRAPVLFADAARTLLEGEPHALLEVGPRETLTTLARQQAPAALRGLCIASLGDGGEPRKDRAGFAGALGQLWCAGVEPDWMALHAGQRRRRVPLPTYPFERKRYWPDIETRKTPMSHAPAQGRAMRLHAEICQLIEDSAGISAADATPATSFLELGLDSLFLTQFALKLQKQYGLKITFRQLLEQYATLGALVAKIDGHLPAEAAPVAAAAPTPTPVHVPASQPEPARAFESAPALAAVAAPAPMTVPQVLAPLPAYAMQTHAPVAPGIEGLLHAQLTLMTRQLEMLSGRAMQIAAQPQAQLVVQAVQTAQVAPVSAPTTTPPPPPKREKEVYDAKKAFGAAARITLTDSIANMSPKQRQAFDDFIVRYCAKTRESKRLTQFHRSHLADPRVVTGFKPHLKEIIYQPIIARSKGSRMWDVDGNEYVDALCGFGMNYFGWSPDFINKAVAEQLEKGIDIGPMTPLAGEVAKLVCDMTGFDRAGFCNTGSEAVMGCMRVARTITGRDKIAIFAGSYHGIFDEVIVRAARGGRAIPAAPGIMSSTAENVVVLDYGTPEALEWIRTNAHELAAVLCETIQSRRADFQPKEFLEELRKITTASGSALIFDEVITGFRLAPGGAQEFFGIKADLASYGKVVGGGFPIGIIAGRREWIDALDGGGWKFGDDSKPEVGVTYFAGTFVRHPPALAAARAALLHLKEKGPGLQREMNARTTKLADELNALFKSTGIPLHVKHMGSLWRATFTEELPFGDLMFTWMRFKGVHIWDGFPCFLTTAHTEADVQFIVRCFRETIAEMQAVDLLPGKSQPTQAAAPNAIPEAVVANGRHAQPPVPGARLGRDAAGYPAWFVADPENPGKFKQVNGKS